MPSCSPDSTPARHVGITVNSKIPNKKCKTASSNGAKQASKRALVYRIRIETTKPGCFIKAAYISWNLHMEWLEFFATLCMAVKDHESTASFGLGMTGTLSWTARSNQSILKEINPEYSLEGLMLWSSNPLATWREETAHWKRPWCWERLRARGEGGNRGWDSWMASLTQWTCVWANSKRWWRTGKPDVLQLMQLRRVKHDLASASEQQVSCSK